MNDIKSCQKVAPKFICSICYYSTCKKSSFDKHLLSATHIRMTTDAKSCSKVAKEFICECGNVYKYRQGLSKHRKKCTFESDIENTEEKEKEKETKSKEMSLVIPDSPNVVMELLKQHGEFKDLIKEQNKIILEQNKHVCELISSGKIGNTTNSHNITNKNKFNINLFLNEQCKDAMNIMDFVNSLQLQLTDLEKVGENGFVKGISNILIKNLKELDINKRPIHCSDLKRETMYVKDENTWEKESGKKDKLTKMIQHVAHKNVKQLPEWQKENPDFNHSESVESEKYLKIVGESMGGSTEDDDIENYNKIIKTIAKEVSIEKE